MAAGWIRGRVVGGAGGCGFAVAARAAPTWATCRSGASRDRVNTMAGATPLSGVIRPGRAAFPDLAFRPDWRRWAHGRIDGSRADSRPRGFTPRPGLGGATDLSADLRDAGAHRVVHERAVGRGRTGRIAGPALVAAIDVAGLGADAGSLARGRRARPRRIAAGACSAAQVCEFAAGARGDGDDGALGGVGFGLSRPGVAQGRGVGGDGQVCGDESGAGRVGGARAGIPVLGCRLGAADGFGPGGWLRGRGLRRSYR